MKIQHHPLVENNLLQHNKVFFTLFYVMFIYVETQNNPLLGIDRFLVLYLHILNPSKVRNGFPLT